MLGCMARYLHVTWIKFYVNTFRIGHTHTYLFVASSKQPFHQISNLNMWYSMLQQQHTSYCWYWHFRPSFDSLSSRLWLCLFADIYLFKLAILPFKWNVLFSSNHGSNLQIFCLVPYKVQNLLIVKVLIPRYKCFIVQIKLGFISTSEQIRQ